MLLIDLTLLKITSVHFFTFMIGDSVNQSAEKQGLIQKMNVTASHHGIDVMVDEAYYDNLNLQVGLRVIFPEGTKGYTYIEKLRYTLAGKTYTREYEEDLIIRGSSMKWRFIGNDTYYGTFQPMVIQVLPQTYTMELVIERIAGIDGEWKLAVPISRKETEPLYFEVGISFP